MTEIRRAASVRGVVQGVSFRWYTSQQAGRLGLTGWIRNEPDGSVRLEAQGDEAHVDELVDWLHRGPTHARVSTVEVEERGVVPGEADFRIQG